jgi:hypothetical protein
MEPQYLVKAGAMPLLIKELESEDAQNVLFACNALADIWVVPPANVMVRPQINHQTSLYIGYNLSKWFLDLHS